MPDAVILFFRLNRHLAKRISPLLVTTPLKPNHITTLALLSGVLAAYLASWGSRNAMLMCAAFLHLSFLLDKCDGQVARIKSQTSMLGMWYDNTADLVVYFCLWSGLAWGAVVQGMGQSVLFWMVAAYIGSVVHFVREVEIRKRSPKDASESNALSKSQAAGKWYEIAWKELSVNGDLTFLVWILALIGSAALFLIIGGLYINSIWIVDVVYFFRSSRKNKKPIDN